MAVNYKGLKEFKIALRHASLKQILEEALEIACDPTYDGIWGSQDSWSHFAWAFGQAWRKHYHRQMDRIDLCKDLRMLSERFRPSHLISIDLRCMARSVSEISEKCLIPVHCGDVAATFPIGHVLSKKMLERVALTVGISERYVLETYT